MPHVGGLASTPPACGAGGLGGAAPLVLPEVLPGAEPRPHARQQMLGSDRLATAPEAKLSIMYSAFGETDTGTEGASPDGRGDAEKENKPIELNLAERTAPPTTVSSANSRGCDSDFQGSPATPLLTPPPRDFAGACVASGGFRADAPEFVPMGVQETPVPMLTLTPPPLPLPRGEATIIELGFENCGHKELPREEAAPEPRAADAGADPASGVPDAAFIACRARLLRLRGAALTLEGEECVQERQHRKAGAGAGKGRRATKAPTVSGASPGGGAAPEDGKGGKGASRSRIRATAAAARANETAQTLEAPAAEPRHREGQRRSGKRSAGKAR